MWWWTIFLYLLIFNGHASSQSITDDSENARQARQLDFGECCPCPGPHQPDDGYGAQESPSTFGDSTFARSRDLDDCPCRNRHSDSEGASSIFFPTSMRADGSVVRSEKKEDPKPLLHPEVDLASSVLQTLREATDEEYQEALARDAARSMSKAAEETIFGDAVPEASSGNIVTIIVNPKQTDSLDDGIPQESHAQESRCIHAPLENPRKSMSKVRVAPKSHSLLRDIFGLPRINKSSGILHRNLLDMDSSAGASNVQERVVHVDTSQDIDNNKKGMRKFAPLMKLDKNTNDKSADIKSSIDDDCNKNKIPDFKLPLIQNKLKDSLEGKTNPLSLIPKMRSWNSISKAKGNNNEDQSLMPSNIHEKAKASFFKTKSHLENILQKSRPVSIKNLLKLKDVELVPLKDLIPKTTERPKLTLPALFNKKYDVIPTKVFKVSVKNEAKQTSILKKVPRLKAEAIDHEVSPSNVIEHTIDDNCHDEAFKTTETGVDGFENKISPTETEDAVSSPSDTESVVSNTSNGFGKSQLDEMSNNADGCDIQTASDTETNFPQSKESFLDSEAQGFHQVEKNSETEERSPNIVNVEDTSNSRIVLNEGDCDLDINNVDSISDTSNNINNAMLPQEKNPENLDNSLVNQNIAAEELCSQEIQTNENPQDKSNTPVKLILKPLSLDKTLINIKENIIKKMEQLKYPTTKSKNSNVVNQPTTINDTENKEPSLITEESRDSDCENEESNQVTTTIKPEICDDVFDDKSDSPDKVSMRDLQEKSDSMLQHENREQESKNMECNDLTHENTDPEKNLELNSSEEESVDSKQQKSSNNEMENNLQIDKTEKNNVENTCQSDLVAPNRSMEQQSDANSEASEIMINKACPDKSVVPQQDLEQQTDPSPGASEVVITKTCPDDSVIAKQASMQEAEANSDASEVIINRVPQNNEISSPFLLDKVVQPKVVDFSILNSPIPEIKLAPIPTLDEIKERLNGFFNKNAQDIEEHSKSEADAMTDTSNIFRSSMTPDASTNNLQSKQSLLGDVNLDILNLGKTKTKFSLPKDLKTLKLQSVFEDKDSILGATSKSNKISKFSDNPLEAISNLDLFRARSNTQKVGKMLRQPELFKNSVLSSPGIGDLTENFDSNAKRTLRTMQRTIESKFREATKKPKLQSNNLLETISRKHEDLNDKLKALHVDFNDRLETMRNSLYDMPRLGTDTGIAKDNSRSFSAFSTNLSKDKKSSLRTAHPKQGTSRRESKKTLNRQRQNGSESAQRLANHKFKMPAAASVPVPKTIEVPELKTTLTKSPRLGTQKSSIKTAEASPSLTTWKLGATNLLNTNKQILDKKINPFRGSQFRVTFSTTPRPPLPTRLPSKSSTSTLHSKSFGGSRQDHNGSPSEIIHSTISSSKSGINSDGRSTANSNLALQLSSTKSAKNDIEKPVKSSLQSWPKVTESAFLSKVRDAVKARLSKGNSSALLKETNTQIGTKRGSVDVLPSNIDMARSASENVDIIERQALKENVSYKCTMVCTKE